MITLIFNVLYFLKMRPNFDVWYQIKPNCWNIFMAVFIDLWPCLFTTKLSYTQVFKWGHSNTHVYNVKFLPGQASKLQVREDTPLQELPPFRGFWEMDLVCLPSPQVVLQDDHGLHWQSTGSKNKINIRKIETNKQRYLCNKLIAYISAFKIDG